ncbi:MAG: hypothetical protein MJ175_04490 [Clostridia bacterium]|nr:hypothetical protein [Clostridia bacterium]
MIQHAGQNFETVIKELARAGFGGVVMNCEWHTSQNDTNQYLEEKSDFEDLDRRIEIAGAENFGVWLYDEKGYPSGSADGLTLASHPEYEAKGLAQLIADGDFTLPDIYDKIVYACKRDGTPVAFDTRHAKGAELVYAVRTAFEGSHAEKCGWGPRRYPNLMSHEAVRAFIDCTYEKYFAELKHFSEFQAPLTDEPSLMSGYVNLPAPMTDALVAWEDSLPDVYLQTNGVSLYPTLPAVFSEDESVHIEKIRFWETVGNMVCSAYFEQIADWCTARGLPFSGHCLLEECIDEHVPLYGKLVQCLKAFTWPGVDILTGDPKDYEGKEFPYYMAAQYVGGAARMTGRTQNVMVEICPIQRGQRDYTFEEERGTMNKIFFSGINHINSYLTASRLGDNFKEYAAHAARVTHVLRSAVWDGRIGMYYPIETVQGVFRPSRLGVNCGAYTGREAQTCMKSINDLTLELRREALDSTVVDAQWIREANISDGCLSANGLIIGTLILPNALYLPKDVSDKLAEWQKHGGHLIFTDGAPEGFSVCPDPIAAAKAFNPPDMIVEGVETGSVWINAWLCEGKRIWYILNTAAVPQTLTLRREGAFTIWNNNTGEITECHTVTVDGYSSIFAVSE